MAKTPVNTGNNTSFADGTAPETFAFADAGLGGYTAVVDPANPTRSLAPAVDGSMPVSSRSTVTTNTPTVSTTPAYTAGDVVGGKQTFASVFRTGVGSGILQSLSIIDKSSQAAGMVLTFFSADPSASTFTDNAAFAINAADMAKVVAQVVVPNTAYNPSLGGIQFAQVAGIGKVLAMAAAGTTLYMVAYTTGTPTYGSTSALTFGIDVLND